MGRHYQISEAVEWFVDGAADGYGFDAGDVKPSEATRAAWRAWEAAVDVLWAAACGTVDASTGLSDVPDAPEGLAVQTMHEYQGAGSGIWDSDDLTEGQREALLSTIGDVYEQAPPGLRSTLRDAFEAFERAVDSDIWAAREARAGRLLAPFLADVQACEDAAGALGGLHGPGRALPRALASRYREALATLFWALSTPEETDAGHTVDTCETTWDLVEGLDWHDLVADYLVAQGEGAAERAYLSHWRG